MLNESLAQSIVDRTMSVLHVNVNIMDVNGRVIAAGNRERVGAFHSAAAAVIATGRKRTVTAAEAAGMDGVKPGITLPILYENTIIGALGMTGDPALVEKYGELVVLTAQLMIEQEEMKEQVYQEQRARESVLIDLFTGRCLENEALFQQRAALFSGWVDRPQLIMAAHLSMLEGEKDPLQCQQRKDRLLDHLAGFRLRGAAVAACFLNNRLAVLCPMPGADLTGQQQRERAQEVCDFLREETRGEVLLSVGGLCADWREIPAAFQRADGTLGIARKCAVSGGAFLFEHYLTEYALLHIPARNREDFVSAVFGRLLSCRKEQRNQCLETLRRYYNNDMNAQKTAADLFIHRNTLNMRLNKIRDLTGYAPQTFQDAFVLRMALVLSDIRDGDPEH